MIRNSTKPSVESSNAGPNDHRRRTDVEDTHSSARHGSRLDTTASRHEDSDVSVPGIFMFCVALLLSAIVIHGMIWLLFQYFSDREAVRSPTEYPLAAGQGARVPPEPRLQTDPRADLRELRAHENMVLSTYGWVDKDAGVVRIPVEEAMKITVQRGLPARSAPGDAAK
jgi:hypothetical protein